MIINRARQSSLLTDDLFSYEESLNMNDHAHANLVDWGFQSWNSTSACHTQYVDATCLLKLTYVGMRSKSQRSNVKYLTIVYKISKEVTKFTRHGTVFL